MSQNITASKPERNRALECLKLLTACCLVLLHIPFQGTLYILSLLLSKYMIPFFLLIAGYFNFNASTAAIRRRFLYILKLNLAASAFYCCLNAFAAARTGIPMEEYLHWSSVLPRLPDFATLIITHINPMAEHLWYLTAMCLCYAVLWVYTSVWGEKQADYRPLYLVGFLLIFLLIFVGSILPSAGFFVPYSTVRNGWVMGLGFFFTGMFLRQYQEILIQNLHLTSGRLLVVIGACLGIMLMRLRQVPVLDFPPEQAVLAIALMMLCIVHPQLPIRSPWLNRVTLQLSALYTGIYILHPAVGMLYSIFLKDQVLNLLGRWEAYATPLIALALTIVAALALDALKRLVARR